MLPKSFLILIFLTCIPFSLTSHITLSDSEIEVISNLKQEWQFSPFVKSWNPSNSSCAWLGIQCTNSSITGISLPYQNISAMIPTTICGLQNLSTLNLSYNSIPGGFPTVLYNCSKLQTLDLSFNNHVGHLPSDIHKLSNLRYLDIGSNGFMGDIPSSIGQLTKLTYLSLQNNSFDGTFPSEIVNFMNLETLSMGNNSFSTGKIPKEYGRLKKLKYLFMQRCNLTGKIPHELTNLSSLQVLDLSSNNLIGEIPSGLFQLKNLTSLLLHENHLYGKIPLEIEASNLLEIILFENNLTGSIPEDIGRLYKLEKLHLYYNQLSGSLPISLANLSGLQELDLSDNYLVGTIPSGLFKLKKLTTLRLLHNQLSGEIPQTIEALNLTGIFLDGNNLRGPIPKDFGKLKNLEKLYMYNNQLSGPIPESLTKCAKIQSLNIASNKLNGEVPTRLWLLPNIARLSLFNNHLSGKLPPRLSPSLYYLRIHDNKFLGTIPLDSPNWESLVVFHASNNQLKGQIPVEFTALSKLNDLKLDGNFFSGDFPSRITSWKSLASLNLSRNNLSGPLPRVLGSLSLLRYLDLSNNNFSGQIPHEYGRLILDKLNLSSNKLQGKVPFLLDNVAFQGSFLNNPNLCSNNGVLHIKKCPSSMKTEFKLILAIGAPILLILCVTSLTLYMTKSHFRNRKKRDKQPAWEMTAFHKLDFTESKVISGLINDNVIGSGGSGMVYRIDINDLGKKAAVKRIMINKTSTHSLEKQFRAEVEILGRIRHANIVKLWCCISRGDLNLLVYEYLENESLDKWLRREELMDTSLMSMHYLLDWPARMKIAIGVAKGLSYMHHDCCPPIIHRDVKSSNILLDAEFNAKVADFGLAKISANTSGESYTASTIAGSFGYIAPEYTRTRRLNEKIDVYSFGVVLLELATGKEPCKGDDYLNLADWSQKYIYEGFNLEDVLDHKIMEPQYLEEMVNVLKLGIMCTSAIPSSRPSMKQALEFLISFNSRKAS